MTDEQQDKDHELWRAWRKMIAEELDRVRPDRYDDGDTGWMEPIFARARARMPLTETEIVIRHVEREVRNQETQAVKRGNRLIREYREGRRALAWELFGPTPIIAGRAHIRLDVATRQDVRDFTDQAHADNLHTYNRAELALDGYRVLERKAAEMGFEQLSLLGDLPPYGVEEEAA